MNDAELEALLRAAQDENTPAAKGAAAEAFGKYLEPLGSAVGDKGATKALGELIVKSLDPLGSSVDPLSKLLRGELGGPSIAGRLIKAGLSQAAAKKAADRILKTIMAEAEARFSKVSETDEILKTVMELTAAQDPEAPETMRIVLGIVVAFTQFVSRRVAELIAREMPPPVRILSDLALVPLCTLGAPERGRRDAFEIMKIEGEDGAPKAVSIELRQLANEDDQLSLDFHDPAFFLRPGIARNLNSGRWREEALALLPEILGPRGLAVYFWTWADADENGVVLIEPSAVAQALGLRNTTENRDQIAKGVDTLTSIELTLKRKYGPTMDAKEIDYRGRLIQPSTETLDVKTLQDGSRGPRRFKIYRHALPMVSIRRAYNVPIPREAFRLVGEWTPGAGQKKAGYQALVLVSDCYIQARAFATRSGTQGAITYLGPEGFEMPLEDVLTRAGFISPGDFVHNPGEAIFRARHAVDRLVNEFAFLGDGSEVFTGKGGIPMFRFITPRSLRGALAPIAQAQPEKIEIAKAAAVRKARGRGRKR